MRIVLANGTLYGVLLGDIVVLFRKVVVSNSKVLPIMEICITRDLLLGLGNKVVPVMPMDTRVVISERVHRKEIIVTIYESSARSFTFMLKRIPAGSVKVFVF